jgi:hypothetical protein
MTCTCTDSQASTQLTAANMHTPYRVRCRRVKTLFHRALSKRVVKSRPFSTLAFLPVARALHTAVARSIHISSSRCRRQAHTASECVPLDPHCDPVLDSTCMLHTHTCSEWLCEGPVPCSTRYTLHCCLVTPVQRLTNPTALCMTCCVQAAGSYKAATAPRGSSSRRSRRSSSRGCPEAAARRASKAAQACRDCLCTE